MEERHDGMSTDRITREKPQLKRETANKTSPSSTSAYYPRAGPGNRPDVIYESMI